MARTITITIAPGGGVEVEASGFQGKSCHAATKIFEDALKADGATVASVTEKAEAKQVANVAAAQKLQQGA
jgi:hypothetical protein